MPLLEFFLDDRGGQRVQNLRLDVLATLPTLRVQVLDGNDPVDLTGGVVTFSMEDSDGVFKILNAAAVLEDAEKGIIRYDWDTVDVNSEKIFLGQFKIVIGADQYLIPTNADQQLRIVFGKSEFQPQTIIENLSQGIQVVALGGTPVLDAVSRIFKVVVSESDFVTAAVEESIDLFQLPAGAIIQQVKVKHSAAFAGGTLSAYTLSVGSAALTQKYLTDFDVFSAPSATNDKVATSGDEESHDAVTPIKVTAKSVGDDVVDATVGVAEIWVVAISTLSSGALLTVSGLEAQDDGAAVPGGPFKIINFNGFVLVVDEGGGIVGVTAPSGNSVPDDATLEDTGSVLRIKNDGVSNTKLRNSIGVSVIGRTANSTGDPADIAAAADNRVLARAAGVLSFQQIVGAMIAGTTITGNKLANKTISAAQLNEAVSANRGVAGNDEEKTTDTTLAAASELTRGIAINQTLAFEIDLWVEVDGTVPGFKFDLNYTGGTNFVFYSVEEAGPNWNAFNNEGQNGLFDSFNNQRSFAMSSGSNLHLIRVRGVMQDDGSGGTLEVRWAQAISDGDATRLKAGSFINGLPY